MDRHQKAARALEAHAPSLLGLTRGKNGTLEGALARPLGLPATLDSLRADLADLITEEEDGPSLRRALRRFRHSQVVRIALREIDRLADVEQTAREMARLACVILDAALRGARLYEESRRGSTEVPLVALGMGKLGGMELNLGSDVDLVFFYETDEGEVSGSDTTVHELFTRVVRRSSQALGEVTEDGFCFRVDLRLRPEGSRGPLVNSLASAERYYESWGRDWERGALLRARPVAGDLAFGERLLTALEPFVYRRAVDPSVATKMHEMLLRSRRELDVDETRDVKLGRGGIREAEFFVQTLQLIWGGRHPELRVAGTLEALQRLRTAGLVTDREAATLTHAWAFLRRVEHRIHVWTGYQTHTLPSAPEELGRFARSLAFDGAEELEQALAEEMSAVGALFATLLTEDTHKELRVWDDLLDRVARGDGGVREALAAQIGAEDAEEGAAHMLRLARRAGDLFGPVTHERLPALGRTVMHEVAGSADPAAALRHLADFFDRVGGPFPYERLLLERPRTTRRLLALFGASGTLSSAFVGHPEDMDLLLSSEVPSCEEIREAHEAIDVDQDADGVVRELRRLKRSFTLQIGLAYVAGEADRALATDRASELAEGQIRVALEAATRWGERRYGRAVVGTADSGSPGSPSGSGLAVIALGKLGARELGFGGDLDLFFLYSADGETIAGEGARSVTHAELFTRVATRTMQLLRQRHAEGDGYETDTRLRPSGSQGTLVVSLAAFDRYHERGAAAWERQALIRARPVAGDEGVAAAAAERMSALAYRGGATPREELAMARGRMQRELAGETRARYHPKLGYGGLTDVELLVQWLQMHHGEEPTVRTPRTADAIDALAAAGHLNRLEADALRAAYSFLRRVELALKLFDVHREPLLEPRGRTGTHVARLLRHHARDGLTPTEALEETYRRHAESARSLFTRVVGAVDARAPWDVPQ